MKICYSIGFAWTPEFDGDDGWNGIYTVYGLENAQRLAQKVAAEYGEAPTIRRV